MGTDANLAAAKFAQNAVRKKIKKKQHQRNRLVLFGDKLFCRVRWSKSYS
ncbi:hypothetical protein LDG_8983 [Legionella drancourtii LLAP12]|uniref:Uncharacterized protein n=1 Tax=Legionella drancourtii LLAP12 TaxID=658187 RepID=G9EUI8_9GAMM|nr:hypothetical protein LDG_8983 [Legionella drancourtii LLAP12]